MINDMGIVMEKYEKLRGGKDALSILRSKGSMDMEEFERVTAEICGNKRDCRYRARTTLDILSKRGAFVIEDGIAYARYGGDYVRVMESLAACPKTFQDLQDELALSKGEVQAILTDLDNYGEVVRLPPIKNKRYWMLAGEAPDIDPNLPAVDMFADTLIEMCSKKPMFSREIGEKMGLSPSIVSGYMRILVSRGLMKGVILRSQDCTLWYSSDEAFKELNKMVQEGYGRANKGLDFSKGAPIGGRNPDFMTQENLKKSIIDILSDSIPKSENEIMKNLERTRPIKKVLNRMWCDGELDMNYIDGVWKWMLKSESNPTD